MQESPETRRSSVFAGEPKTPIFNRMSARLIDCLIILAIFLLGKALWFPIGLLAAAGYAAAMDCLGVGQSIGKRIFGLRVIEDQLGLPCPILRSVQRNIPFVLGILLFGIPFLWFFALIIVIPLLGLEVYLLASLPSGVRLGDVLGNTLVIEHLDEGLPNFQ